MSPALALFLALQAPRQAAPPAGSFRLDPSGGRLVVLSGEAEFGVSSSGGITARLVRGGEAVEAAGPGVDEVRVDGHPLPPSTFDLAGATRGEGEATIRAQRTGGLEESLRLDTLPGVPGLLRVRKTIRNGGPRPVHLDSLRLGSCRLGARPTGEMWSFHGASVAWGQDEVRRIEPGLRVPNVLATPVGDSWGGGLPLVAFWTRRVGVAIGHLETGPVASALPVEVGRDGSVQAALTLSPDRTLGPGESYEAPATFVAVYAGDFYEALRLYATALQAEGLVFDPPPRQAYSPSWCGWGYEFDVTPAQMRGVIPELVKLGVPWGTLDDRWFSAYGDWEPRADTFPGDSIRELTRAYHEAGLFLQLWWVPLVAEDGQKRYESHVYRVSRVVREHPEWLILDRAGRHARTRRGLASLCPALPEVRDYTRALTEKFIGAWGFDGNKLDESYTVPPCYNPAHHHRSPEDSIRALGDVYRLIRETTRRLKPEGVTQICSCGTTPNLAWINAMDQAVTADPVGSVQVRRRLKILKGLLGPEAAVYGDHVELTRVRIHKGTEIDDGEDFASTLGLGGVPGTKFVWPEQGGRFGAVALTPRKEALWQKWLDLYNRTRLSEGTFLNLYRTGFDRPEAYVVRKEGRYYYAFFAEGEVPWRGPLELRGLPTGRFALRDYVNDRGLGTVEGGSPTIDAPFVHSLLLEATPIPP